ncbi:MAG: isochorismate synthase [Polyangiaceae bacterium]|nr:isochorismate synthase [Polyangiaceae bacterium]
MDPGVTPSSPAPARTFALDRARRALEAVAGRDELVVLHLDAPAIDPASWLRCEPDEAAVLWEPPGGPALAGRGAACTVQGRGELRFAEVASKAGRLWPRVREHGIGDAAPPRSVLIGGFSFAPGSGPSALGDAWFVLPEWRYARAERRGWLSLAVRGEACATSRGREAWLAALERELERIGTLAGAGRSEPPRPVSSDPATGAPTDAWLRGVGAALSAIERGEASKVVLARTLEVPGPVAPPGVVCARLARLAPESARFALHAGRATFLGATPERLVARRGRQVRTEALAGTARAAASDAGERLLASEKDLREHAVVVQAIRAALQPVCTELEVSQTPALRTLRDVQHLATPIRGTLASPMHLLELAERLHPTPAVCGEPREVAARLLAAHEEVPRGWYAGVVGAFDAAGDGELWVALRSALVGAEGARLHAGAGLVAGSDARAEWEETNLKLRRMREALGAPP